MKKKELVDRLAEILKSAKEAGDAADTGSMGDKGACNLDTPAFRIARVRESTILQAADKAGVRVTEFNWFGERWYWLVGVSRGIASRRTRMVTAAQDVLEKIKELPGGQAAGYFQAD